MWKNRRPLASCPSAGAGAGAAAPTGVGVGNAGARVGAGAGAERAGSGVISSDGEEERWVVPQRDQRIGERGALGEVSVGDRGGVVA